MKKQKGQVKHGQVGLTEGLVVGCNRAANVLVDACLGRDSRGRLCAHARLETRQSSDRSLLYILQGSEGRRRGRVGEGRADEGR